MNTSVESNIFHFDQEVQMEDPHISCLYHISIYIIDRSVYREIDTYYSYKLIILMIIILKRVCTRMVKAPVSLPIFSNVQMHLSRIRLKIL